MASTIYLRYSTYEVIQIQAQVVLLPCEEKSSFLNTLVSTITPELLEKKLNCNLNYIHGFLIKMLITSHSLLKCLTQQ
jgi:hypothetical protein